MAGQNRSGGWSYDCGYPLNAQEQAKLTAELAKESRLVITPKKGPEQRDDLPVDPKAQPKANPPKKEEPKAEENKPALHPEVVELDETDESNAQSGAARHNLGYSKATIRTRNSASWGCGAGPRKHGLPCDKAIELNGKQGFGSQSPDGGWGYMSGESTPAMTCARA